MLNDVTLVTQFKQIFIEDGAGVFRGDGFEYDAKPATRIML